ncbi:hypothetical protein [Pseudomonas protegens]|uniref:hypothetical protein n=1 Tax=Pseudomonas protegens TaxID=380021 RepID=UPI000CCE2A57|nr:hypothetical protein [Pseudomonas protegens]PNV99377.1 hypothetical protein C1633_06195 [Pseudomonas protegens]
MPDSRNELPLCPKKYIQAVSLIKGPDYPLTLIRSKLQLNENAELIFSEFADSYFLKVDDQDRWENQRVGMIDAVSTMPFKSLGIFKEEIVTWSADDVARAQSVEGFGD